MIINPSSSSLVAFDVQERSVEAPSPCGRRDSSAFALPGLSRCRRPQERLQSAEESLAQRPTYGVFGKRGGGEVETM